MNERRNTTQNKAKSFNGIWVNQLDLQEVHMEE